MRWGYLTEALERSDDGVISIHTTTQVFTEHGFETNSINVIDGVDVALVDEVGKSLVDDLRVIRNTLKAAGCDHSIILTVHLIETVFE